MDEYYDETTNQDGELKVVYRSIFYALSFFCTLTWEWKVTDQEGSNFKFLFFFVNAL